MSGVGAFFRTGVEKSTSEPIPIPEVDTMDLPPLVDDVVSTVKSCDGEISVVENLTLRAAVAASESDGKPVNGVELPGAFSGKTLNGVEDSGVTKLST
jgi:hypothetical protein